MSSVINDYHKGYVKFVTADDQEHQMNIDKLVVFHESAHAFAAIKKPFLHKVIHISVDPANSNNPKVLPNTDGYVTAVPTLLAYLTHEELTNQLVAAFVGMAADQISLSAPMLTDMYDIVALVDLPRYRGDRAAFKTVVDKYIICPSPSFQPSRYPTIASYYLLLVMKIYQEAYQFVEENYASIKKIADVLEKQKTIAGNNVYTLLDRDMPLLSYEQGPLPEELMRDYDRHRKTRVYMPFIDRDKDEITYLPNGTVVTRRYFLDGSLSQEDELYTDGNEKRTRCNGVTSSGKKIIMSQCMIFNNGNSTMGTIQFAKDRLGKSFLYTYEIIDGVEKKLDYAPLFLHYPNGQDCLKANIKGIEVVRRQSHS